MCYSRAAAPQNDNRDHTRTHPNSREIWKKGFQIDPLLSSPTLAEFETRDERWIQGCVENGATRHREPSPYSLSSHLSFPKFQLNKEKQMKLS